MTLSRDFKGVWIPKEIWLRKDISIAAKFLWAEIDSFSLDERDINILDEEFLNLIGLEDEEALSCLKELETVNLVYIHNKKEKS